MLMKHSSLPPLDSELGRNIQSELDQKTKPLASLGRLEELALRLGQIQNRKRPELSRPHLLVFAGDHGIAAHGVSPFPQSVTAAMVRNFAQGGAAINVLTRTLGWELALVNSGTIEAIDCPEVLDRRMGAGTESYLLGPAMSQEQYAEALRIGAAVFDDLYAKGCRLLALGEMGIGNSSSAALLIHYLCDAPLDSVLSRGAGCNDQELAHKAKTLEAVRLHHGSLDDPDEILRRFGGFEMVMAAGSMLAAAAKRVPVVIDGLIMSSVALAAIKARPGLEDFLIFAHRSSADGHARLLEHLGVSPLLDLGMRLGEGSGAALALPLLQSAVAILNEMATFASAEVASRLES